MSNDEINGNAESDPLLSHKKTKATHQVTELKHKAATGFHAQSASGVNGVKDFPQKVVFDMERHKASQLISREKLDMEHQHEECLK